MSINNDEKDANVNPNVIIENIKEQKDINNNKTPKKSKNIKSPIKSNSNDNFKKEKKKRNRKKKNDKMTKSKNLNSTENNFGGGILSEIKQISIPAELSEKEELFKILQSEIINIDKSLSLLIKKKKYYNEISQKLSNEIQNEKKKLKKNEIKNKEYLYMENLLKDYDINDTYENLSFIGNNSYYNMSKNIDKSLDYNYFFLNEKNYKNFLVIHFFDEKNNNQINNKMEPNNQVLTYEEFNNMSELDNNFCLLMSNNNSNLIDNNNVENNDNKIICDSEESKDKDMNENKNKMNKTDSQTSDKNIIDIENEEFTVIEEALPEEEETNIKKKNKISIGNDKNNINDSHYDNDNNNNNDVKEKDIDRSINKKYSDNLEELDFYLLKDSRKKEIKEKKKKKITFEDIQKKYKTQDMGSDYLKQEESSNSSSSSSSSMEEKEKKYIKKKKNKNKNKINKSNNSDSNKNEESEKDKNDIDNKDDKSNESNEYIENSEVSQDIEKNSGNKKKKRGRKKKKKEIKKSFSLEEELPDPENLDSTALALEMKKYGMKPQNKKRNIEILKSVYNFLKIKELPENISHKLTTFDLDIDDENNTDGEKDNQINSKNKEGNIPMTELSDEQKKKIIEIIKENKTIYEKILLFKEISLKEIKTLINSKGIIVSNRLLTQLLIDSGVVLPGGWNDKK
jgi:hypothetical protein